MTRFITVEGIDGSGTTSVSEALCDRIGGPTRLTQEPSELWTGRMTRESFEERDVPELTRFYLFMADRVAHVDEVVRPALRRGVPVICDRGPDSTRAYQYYTSDLSEEFIETNLAKTMESDLTIWLDVDIEVAAERTEGEDAFEEKRELQRRVAQRYCTLHEQHDRIVRVDANQDFDDVVEAAYDTL